MAVQFHTLSISEVIRETPDAISIRFAIPDHLKADYQYKAGQYLTLQVFIRGERYRRAYSLSSSPVTDNVVQVTSKRVEGGVVSNFLNDFAEPGLEIDVMTPMGNFVADLDANKGVQYVLIAGGSGITPVYSILKSVLATQPASKVLLLYGNRNATSIIFHQELDALAAAHADRLKIVHTLEDNTDLPSAGKGLMNRDTLRQLVKEHAGSAAANAEYFMCGPSGMMREADLLLEELLVDKARIHKEHFTSTLDVKEEGVVKERPAVTTDEGPLQFPVKATIILDGQTTEIEIGEKDTILEAAIDAGIDPPFACQIGACSTCRAKLQQGKVSMDEREALTDSEIEEGYVLTCQSHPLTNTLVVDYDS